MNILGAIVLAFVSGAAPLQEASQQTSPATTRPAARRPDARMGMTIPPTVSERDIRRYGELLQLSAPQQLFLDEAFKRYTEAISVIVQSTLPELDDLNAQVCTLLFRDGFTQAMAAATNRFLDKQDETARQLSQVETVLFAELDSVLAESQRELMPRVRNHRARGRCCAFTNRIIRSSQVDLAAWLDEMISDREILMRLDPVLLEYEQRLTPLTVALDVEMRSQDRTLLELIVWGKRDDRDQPLPSEVMQQRSLVALDRQVTLLREGVALQHAIEALNGKTLPLLLERLPADRAAAIKDRYQRTAFPTVYVIQETAFDLCDAAEKPDKLNDAQRQAIAVIGDTYRTAYASTCTEMEEQCRLWQDHFARTRGSMDKYEPYRLKMRELRDKRWELGLQAISQTDSVLASDPVPEVSRAAEFARGMILNAIRESHDPNVRYPGM